MFERTPRSTIIFHSTPNFVRVAKLERGDSHLLVVSAAAEFLPEDEDALAGWITKEVAEGNGWIAGWCGFLPASAVIFREELNLREGPHRDTMIPLVQRHARSQSEDGWIIGCLDAATGTSLLKTTGNQSMLVTAVPRQEIRTQQRLLVKHGIRPRQLEISTLSCLAAIIKYFQASLADATIALCEFGPNETMVYFIDRKGVHPQSPLPFGLNTLDESAKTDLKLGEIEAAKAALDAPDEALLKRAPRLLQIYARHLRLTVDYFEHQTGRIVGSMFPCNLPAKREWLGPILARAADLPVPPLDLKIWAETVGLQFEELPQNGAGWMPTLALAASNQNSDDGAHS